MLPSVVPQLKQMVIRHPMVQDSPRALSFINHPAGPFTIHFWAPAFKWGISLANLADMRNSPETISLPQQIAVTATGIIWSRYSTVITPINYNLLSVNVFMAGTGMIQLYRKLTYKGAIAAQSQLFEALPAHEQNRPYWTTKRKVSAALYLIVPHVVLWAYCKSIRQEMTEMNNSKTRVAVEEQVKELEKQQTFISYVNQLAKRLDAMEKRKTTQLDPIVIDKRQIEEQIVQEKKTRGQTRFA